jgi:hypothetical protein
VAATPQAMTLVTLDVERLPQFRNLRRQPCVLLLLGDHGVKEIRNLIREPERMELVRQLRVLLDSLGYGGDTSLIDHAISIS